MTEGLARAEPLARHRAEWRGRALDDTGAAIVEFLGLTLVLLVPLVYLIVTLGQVQAAAFAAESAAREAARAALVTAVDAHRHGASTSEAMALGGADAQAAAVIIAEDFGVDSIDVELGCSSMPCLAPGSDVVSSVHVRVTLVGVPGFVDAVVPLGITLDATGSSPVDGLAAAP